MAVLWTLDGAKHACATYRIPVLIRSPSEANGLNADHHDNQRLELMRAFTDRVFLMQVSPHCLAQEGVLSPMRKTK